jgi:hypothetical protein
MDTVDLDALGSERESLLLAGLAMGESVRMRVRRASEPLEKGQAPEKVEALLESSTNCTWLLQSMPFYPYTLNFSLKLRPSAANYPVPA